MRARLINRAHQAALPASHFIRLDIVLQALARVAAGALGVDGVGGRWRLHTGRYPLGLDIGLSQVKSPAARKTEG